MFIGSKPKDLFPRQNKAAADFYRRQQQKKIHAKGPYLVQRSFRRNEGTTDYETIPAVTLTGDFVIEFDALINNTTYSQLLSGNDSTINIRNDDGVALAVGGVQHNFTPSFTRGLLEPVIVTRVGDQVSCSVSGVSETLTIPVVDFNIVNLGRNTTYGTNSPLKGILANLKIWDNGTLIRDYPLDDNSDDLRELASGQNGTVINGNASDWGLFQQQATGEWLGQELAVNGGFDTDSDWVKESEWSISGGLATMASTSAFNTIRQAVGFVGGLRYQVNLDIISVTGNMKAMEIANIGTSNLPLFQFNSIGRISENVIIDASGGRPAIGFAREVVTSSCSIDNVSVKEVLNVA